MITRFFNAKVLRNHKIRTEDLWIEDGKIISPAPMADHEVDVTNFLIAPGYIDLQINGGFGVDFTTDPKRVDEVASQLPKYGVTAFLPTVVSTDSAHYKDIIPFLQPKKTSGQSEILGIHLEGPFFNPRQVGAHLSRFIRSFLGVKSLENFYGSLKGVKMVSLAPELQGSLSMINELKEKNIVAAAGHTEATFVQMEEAIKAGLKAITHLFNAMIPFHHREPGVVGTALINHNIYYSMIVDGVHSHSTGVNLAWKVNSDGFFLVTDAIAALGQGDGNYSLGDMEVNVNEGKACTKGTGRLAGSVLSMDAAVRNLKLFTGCSEAEAIEAASLKPAQLLGIQASKGTLNVGADADFIFLDKNLEVHATYVCGELVFALQTNNSSL